MAATEDLAPNRPAAKRSSGNGSARRTSRSRSRASDDDLQAQVEQLQADFTKIAGTIAGMADNKVSETRGAVKNEAKHIAQQGQNAIEDIQDEFGHMEKQIKDTIREKPLTAVAGAVAIGFVLALITR